MNLGAPASLPAWQSARNTPAGMPAVPTTRRFMGGEQVRKEHGASHEPPPLVERVPGGRVMGPRVYVLAAILTYPNLA